MTIDCLGRDNDKFGLLCEDASKTVQADAKEADINYIVRRFGITGELPSNLEFVTNVDLVDDPDDYRGALEILERADAQFMAMPAEVRAEFKNDPAAFMDFVSDNKNLDRMRELGLAVPKKEEPAAPAPPVPPK